MSLQSINSLVTKAHTMPLQYKAKPWGLLKPHIVLLLATNSINSIWFETDLKEIILTRACAFITPRDLHILFLKSKINSSKFNLNYCCTSSCSAASIILLFKGCTANEGEWSTWWVRVKGFGSVRPRVKRECTRKQNISFKKKRRPNKTKQILSFQPLCKALGSQNSSWSKQWSLPPQTRINATLES